MLLSRAHPQLRTEQRGERKRGEIYGARNLLRHSFWVGVAAIFPHYFAAPGMREKEGEFVGGIDGGRARAARFVVPSGTP